MAATTPKVKKTATKEKPKKEKKVKDPNGGYCARTHAHPARSLSQTLTRATRFVRSFASPQARKVGLLLLHGRREAEAEGSQPGGECG